MSKNLISIIAFVILLCIFISGFTVSYTSHNMENLAYVLALGVDVGEKAKLKVSAQFSKTAIYSSSSSSSEDTDSIVLVSAEADSIFSALNLLNTYIGKELNLAHCSVVIFSEDFAKQGISTEIFSLMNNEEVRPSTNIVVSKCDAYEYLNNAKPNLEKLTIKYYDTFSITSRFTGYIADLTIGDFYNDYCSPTCDPTAILGGLNSTARNENSDSSGQSGSSESSSSSGGESSGGGNSSSESGGESGSGSSGSGNSSSSGESTTNEGSTSQQENVVINPQDLVAGNSSVIGKRGTENIGIAVFDGDKYRGELTALEAVCHLLIYNDMDSFIISIDNPMLPSEKMELQMTPAKKTKFTSNITDDENIRVSIDVKLNADVLTLEDDIDYQSNETLEKISQSAEEHMEKEFHDYLNKVSKEYECNIDKFCTKMLSNFATMQEWKDFNFKDKYKDAEFDINVDVNVVSSLLLTKT